MSYRIAAASIIGPIEAMKDQGLCRLWINYTVKCVQHQAKKYASSSPTMENHKFSREAKLRYNEDSLRTIMYISSWGLN